jgi:salicylate hydroxylase
MDCPLKHRWWSALNEAPTSRGTKSAKSVRVLVTLSIIVLGAGIGGLAAAHVRSCWALHHTARAFMRAVSGWRQWSRGEGQCLAQRDEAFFAWGLGICVHVVKLTVIVLRQFDTRQRVRYMHWFPHIERELRDHGTPYYQIHRADYHPMLHLLACTALGATRLPRHHCMRYAT